MQSIQKTFQQTAKRFAGKIAIAQKTDQQWMQITFNEFSQKVNAAAGFLKDQGINKTDKVGIILDNGWQWATIFFAVMARGAIAVPLSPESSAQELNNIILDAEPALVFASKEVKDKQLQAEKIIYIENEDFKNAINVYDTQNILQESEPEDIACILYTSGTTAKPKGVMLSQKNLLSNYNSIDKLHLAKSNDRIIAILPLHHALALTVTLVLPALSGLTIIYPQTFRGDLLLQAMQEQTPTIFLAVPQIFYSLHHKIMERANNIHWIGKIILHFTMQACCAVRRVSGLNIAKLVFFKIHKSFGAKMRLLLSGGARLDPKAADDLYKFGFTIIEGYGLTETSPVLTLNPYASPKFGSVGKPLPDIKIKIHNKNEKGEGEVIAQGLNIMQGYYKQLEQTQEVIKDNWFYTGDLGYIDKQGYLFLTGRAKEVIVLSSGLNIFPEEIETLYSGKAPVKEMCVFDAPSRTKLKDASILWAIVVPDLEYFKSLGEVNLKAVLKNKFDEVSRGLPEHKRIHGFSISLESLSRTLLGKIKRFEVKNAYILKIKETQNKTTAQKNAELSPEHKQLLDSQTGKKVVSYLRQHTQTDAQISPGDLLELDLGVDSLGRVELASGLEKTFGIKIEDEIIGNSFTVEDVIKGVDFLLNKGAGILSDEQLGAHAKGHDWNKRLSALPAQENLDCIDLRPGIFAWLLTTVFVEIIRAILFVFYRLKVRSQSNVPRKGPYIIFANHTSYLDAFILAAALPYYARKDIFFLGFRAYFNKPILCRLIKIGRIIPLDFSTHLLESLRSSYYILNHKKSLCVFPEGFRSIDGQLKDFKKGFGILAAETQAKILPVYIKGAYEAWPRISNRPKLHPLHIVFGDAIDAVHAEKKGFDRGAKDKYTAICLGAQQAIIDLAKEPNR